MTKRPFARALLVLVLSGCGGLEPAHDFTTPEGAMLKVRDAINAHDVEAVVRRQLAVDGLPAVLA